MNKIYRVVWNKETNTWTAVCEYAKSKGKSSSSSGVVGTLSNGVFTAVRFTYTALVSALILVSGQAMAANGTEFQNGTDQACYYDTTSESVICGDVSTKTEDTPGTKTAKSVVLGKGATNTGESNVAVGISASSAGTSSVAVGDRAKAGSDQTIAVGQNAQANARWDVSIGRQAGWNATAPAGDKPEGRNVAIGDAALKNGLDVNNNNVMGTSAGENLKGSHNVIIGTYANAAEAIESAENNGSTKLQINSKTRSVSIIDSVNATKEVNYVETSNSVAIGHRALTTKAAGVAIGQQAKAFGNTSTAVGNGTRALGDNSVAMGNTANAGSGSAIAIGLHANYDSTANTAEAKYRATGASSVAIGARTHAGATHAVTIGTEATTSTTGQGSVAVGSFSKAVGINAAAVGQASQASGQNSFAGGNDSHAVGTSAVSLGDGAGKGTATFANGVKTGGDYASGNSSTAVGTYTKAAGVGATALGVAADAQAYRSVSVGAYSAASANSTVAVGDTSVASATGATAVGEGSLASELDATALGNDTVASGKQSLAVGNLSKATGLGATAIGNNSKAEAEGAQAFGQSSVASALNAAAVGRLATASGERASAFGVGNTASGASSFAGGDMSVAAGADTIAIGKNAHSADLGVISIGRQSGSAGVDLANKGTSDQVADRTKAGKTNASGLVNVTSIGNEAGKDTINNNYGVNIGYQAGSGGYNSTYGEGVAIGNKTGGVDKTNTTVKTAMETFSAGQGATDNAIITGNTNTAISSRAGVNALGHDNVAIGKDAGGYSSGSSNIAIGRHAGRASKLNTPNNEATRVIDGDVFSNARNTISMGEWANASGNDAVAIGRLAQAPVEDSIAIGRGVKTELLAGDGVGDREGMIAIGSETTKASGKAAISIGRNAQGIGRGTVALGDASKSLAGQGVAIGAQANVANTAAGGVAIGSVAKSQGLLAVALGSQSESSANHSVALGTLSQANRAALTPNNVATSDTATVNANQVYALSHASNTDKQAVGATVKGNLGAVSVGTEARTLGNTQIAAATRQIINVAAGSEDSDAVNVAQLKAVANQIAPADNTTIVKNQTGALKVNTAPITVVAAGEPNAGSVSVASGDEGKLATAGDIANAINNSGFTLTASGRNGSLVKSGATVDLKNTDGNIVISKADDSNDVNFDLNEVVAIGTSGGSSRIIIDGRGNIGNIRGLSRNLPKTQSENTAGPGNPSNVTTKQTLPDNVSLITSNAATVGDVLNVGWNVQTNGDATDFVRTYDTVNFADGVGTTITSETDGDKTTFKVNVNAQGLAESAQLPVVYTDGFGNKVYKHTDGKFYDEPNGQGDQIAPGDIVATMQAADGSVVKPTSLTNVAAGANDTDAVNVSQLKGAVTALGGGAQVNLDGSFKAPTYTLTDGNPSLGDTTTYHNVGDALAGLNTAVNQSLSFSGDAGDAFDRKLGSAIKLTGGVTESTKLTDNNIGVVAKDGILDIKLAKDIDLGNDGSVTTGGVQVNNEGLTIIDGPSITKSNGINAGNKVIADVASNLPTTQNNTAIQGSPSNATKAQEAPTNADTIKNNAATVGDVLNAGWNVQTNGDATDFVRTYDTVNFADGVGTTITSETDGDKTTFKVNVNAQGLAESAQLPVVYTKADGTKVYKVGDKFFDNKAGTGTEVPATDIIASMQNADGTITPTTLANIKAGTKDTDAVNVSQLKGVADTLGGGASINADGTINAPTYNITNPADGAVIKAQNVGDALNALNTAVNNPLAFAGDTGLFNRKLGQTTTIKGGITDENKLSNSNIGVVAKDGALDIKLAKDITIDSVTTGNTTVNNEGIIIKAPAGNNTVTDVKLTANGLNNGGNKITNVAEGTVDTDAVNFAQLKEVQKTAKAAKTEVQAGNNMAVTYSTGADGQTIYNVATKPDVLFDSVTVGTGTNQVILDDTGVKVGGKTYISGTGLNANNKKVTNVAKGDVSANSKDAINGSQLYAHGEGVKNIIGGNTTYDPATGAYTNADIGGTGKGNIHDAIASINTTANAGWNVQTNAGNKTNVKPSDTVNFIDGSNIKITNDGTNITVATADDLTVNSVTAGNTVVNNAGVKVGDVQITAGGINAGNQQITNLKSGLNGKTLDDIKADASAPERSNAATIGDLATVQNNVTNITHNYNTVIGGSSADGKVLDSQGNVVTDNQGNRIDVADALKTYNVQDNKAKTDNTIITAIKNMNEGGIKFFHVNDGTGEQNIAGTDTHKEDSTASGKFAAAVGYEAQSTGENALAFGKGSQALAKNAIAIGTGNIVRGENSGAIGDPSIINGANSYSVGNNNTVTTDKTFVLGNEVKQTVANSVFLGDKSSSAGIHTKAKGEHYTYAGANDDNVVGVSGRTAPVGVVSVGTEGGQTRQIQNVAAGVVSANSTDAINGSQLYYTNEAITNVANNTINMGNQLNNRINDVADDANAGVSSAMAMASLPQAYLPGKSMITGGVASYNGEGAVAVGLSKLSDNGRWVLKISGSADTQGNAGGSIGAGFHF
ncbi:YadA-like family protein [Moraxella sp. VT-16-12]|uniref:YadA-like family protein n=1 Tax=Moraxella sp. VT-16-12 TaxID=2014877 RepID=UPI0011B8361E|nr:YadA-like family protein [Moraxella sp. VT-16-12]TWV82908.1 hypothetical protein CEW93_004365 [Moraxella sp. VT-16-12]